MESMRTKGEEPEDEDAQERSPERMATGPFADAELGEQKVDLRALLEELHTARNPDEKIDVTAERESVGPRLEHVSQLIEKEKRKENTLGAVRQELQVPHEASDTLSQLEEARETLEEEQRHIELAGEWNEVLTSFSDLSPEEVRHIAKTGRRMNGESVYQRGKEIHSDLARELAGMYQKGGRYVTWGALNTLRQVADAILKDVVSAVKDIFRGTGQERGGASDAA